MKVVGADWHAAIPCASGGGVTREVATYRDPGRHGDFLWRLSIAKITKCGLISPLHGVDRTIALLDGAGLVLTSLSMTTRLTSATPQYDFAGETEIAYELIDGVSVHFGVMTRREFFRHSVRCEQFFGWTKVIGEADLTVVIATDYLELSSRGRASLGPFDAVSEIRRGETCEFYSDRAMAIVVVEITGQ